MNSPSRERGTMSDEETSAPEGPQDGSSACIGAGDDVNPQSRMLSGYESTSAGVEEMDELGRELRENVVPSDEGEGQDSPYE